MTSERLFNSFITPKTFIPPKQISGNLATPLADSRRVYAILRFLRQRVQEPPFAMLAPRDDGAMSPVDRQYRGYLVDLLEALSKHASFTYSLHAVHDRQRGSRQQDGTWTGLVGEIIAGVSIELIIFISPQVVAR